MPCCASVRLHEPAHTCHIYCMLTSPCVLRTGVIASNGVNGSPRTEQQPMGSGIQVRATATAAAVAAAVAVAAGGTGSARSSPPRPPPVPGDTAGEPWYARRWSFGVHHEQNGRKDMEDRIAAEDLTQHARFAL